MAHQENGHPVLNRREARQAVTLHRMRYVLGISLALAVAGMLIAYFVVL